MDSPSLVVCTAHILVIGLLSVPCMKTDQSLIRGKYLRVSGILHNVFTFLLIGFSAVTSRFVYEGNKWS
jgi:hypothetical protein